MRKDKTNFASGFSIAELLVSMLIAMVIAAALVPVIGPKKIVNLTNRANHGIAECYYDNAGQLHAYYIDDSGDSGDVNGTKMRVRDGFCSLQVQKAPYYEVYVIGAGGSSANFNENDLSFTVRHPNVGDGVPMLSGNIRVTPDDYQSDIRDATQKSIRDRIPVPGLSDQIRIMLDEWANTDQGTLYALYDSITSPIGRGGYGDCKIVTELTPRCSDFFNNSENDSGRNYYMSISGDSKWTWPLMGTYPQGYSWDNLKKCYLFIHGAGQSSGRGIQLSDIHFPINASTEIKESLSFEGTKLFDNFGNYIELTSSGDGENAGMTGAQFIDYSGTAGTDSVCTASSVNNNAEHKRNLSEYCNPPHNSFVASHAGGRHGWEPGAASWTEMGYWKKNTPCDTVDGVGASRGRFVRSGNNVLEWTYATPIFDGKYVSSGKHGIQHAQVYETLPDRLFLYPARTNIVNGQVTSSRILQSEGGQVFISADSGLNGEVSEDHYKVQLVSSDLPRPTVILNEAKANNESYFSYVSKLDRASNRNFRGQPSGEALSVNCAANNTCPGYAGSGVYPYISVNIDQAELRIRSRASQTLKSKFIQMNNAANVNDVEGCGGANDEEEGRYRIREMQDAGGNTYGFYCNDTVKINQGRPGAIIIIW